MPYVFRGVYKEASDMKSIDACQIWYKRSNNVKFGGRNFYSLLIL